MYKLRDFVCRQCGVHFSGKHNSKRQFCTVRCRQAFRNDPIRNPAKTSDARRKISEARVGRPTTAGRQMPAEQRKRISASLTGRKLTSRHRQNISEGLKRIGHRPPRNKHLRGPLHPNWKGGHAAERQKKYKTPEYKQFVTTCLERDGYTCQHCGAKNGRGEVVVLQVHHIKSYAEHEDLRYAPGNGLTLCKSCHFRVGKGQRRPFDPDWRGRPKICQCCGEGFSVRNGRKYCPTCRKRICCPVCGSTKCGHNARKRLSEEPTVH